MVAVVAEAIVLLGASVVGALVLATAELGGMVIELCAHPCVAIATSATPAAIRARDLAIIGLTLTGAVAPLGQGFDDAISRCCGIERDSFAVAHGSIGGGDRADAIERRSTRWHWYHSRPRPVGPRRGGDSFDGVLRWSSDDFDLMFAQH